MISEAGGLIYQANETNMQMIRGDQISSGVTLINIDNVQFVHDLPAILQNGNTVDIVQKKRDIHNKNLQNLSAIPQVVLVLLNTALIIFTLSHR